MYNAAKGTNGESVITSCRILSWPRSRRVWPMRLAGTWTRYSNSAIPQLTSAATIHGRWLRCLRCAYHAKVMKTFEITSRVMVFDGHAVALGGGELSAARAAALGRRAF